MPKNPKTTAKKSSGKTKQTAKPAYLREIQIKYKKKRVKNGSLVGKKIAGARQVYELFSDLQDGQNNVNGWSFWYYRNAASEWARLSDLR